MAAKFEISKDHAGKFRFHLKAPNGEIIAASQGYETKANAEKGIEAIKTHAPGAAGGGPLRLARLAFSQLLAFVEQFVDLTTRRLAAVLADRPAQETGGTVWRCQPVVKTSDRVRLEFLDARQHARLAAHEQC